MLRKSTWFRPRLDGFPETARLSVDTDDGLFLKKLYFSSNLSAAEQVEKIFRGGAGFYRAKRVSSLLIAAGTSGPFSLSAAAAAVCLDFYFSRRFWPGLASPGKPSEMKKQALLAQSVKDRLRSPEHAENVSKLLAWFAVMQSIPEQWISGKVLGKRLDGTVAGAGQFSARSIEVDVRLPVSGGCDWIGEQTLLEWNVLKEKLDGKKPQPLRVLHDCQDPFGQPVFVAFGYEETDDGKGSIRMAFPCVSRKTFRMDFSMREDRIDDFSIAPALYKYPVRGFFVESYTPRKPAATRYPGWLWLPVRIGWWLARWWSIARESVLGHGTLERPSCVPTRERGNESNESNPLLDNHFYLI